MFASHFALRFLFQALTRRQRRRVRKPTSWLLTTALPADSARGAGTTLYACHPCGERPHLADEAVDRLLAKVRDQEVDSSISVFVDSRPHHVRIACEAMSSRQCDIVQAICEPQLNLGIRRT
jgi:hypothetical protein